MTTTTPILDVKVRERGGNLEYARKQGLMPAVFYGRGKLPTPIFVDMVEFLKVYRVAGKSSIIELRGPDIAAKVLIHDLTRNTITGLPAHADFIIVDTAHTMHAKVPLEFTGEAPAIKTHKAVLVRNIHEVEVEAMAKDLPHSVEVDTTSLVDLESHITVADIKLPKGVSINNKPDTIVASLSAEVETEEETSAAQEPSA